MTTAVKRPILRYHGGKFKIGPWIISHFPEHRNYVEPYGGGGSVLLRKDRSYAEVYNDLDGEIVNLFQVLRNPAQGRELIRLVYLTPYARSGSDASYMRLQKRPKYRKLKTRCFGPQSTACDLHLSQRRPFSLHKETYYGE